ncbi:uncharacterized protein MONBRDRAFT_36453 [Monosiga brevicollis MX1]|uniref:Exostosin GT47 domain-containing protein n=1 Tax=Monosiga brevicollis TaxID=81824 RepID=A9UUL4_MONBE|nr:uncharacterized protein MONBRDRAFT_36453 [Monosiga brevicollis MX1]EDQ90921.1 predicted protein [Monosiga brevicollis MX1]|eukprot:XP_001744218.1 hypothetical protein [Monosiga brevicollis MX1]
MRACLALMACALLAHALPTSLAPVGDAASLPKWVPFYVYEFPELDIEHLCEPEVIEEWRSFKHGDDMLFADHARGRHPWRVSDPEEARLFVVPAPLAFYQRNGKCKGKSTKDILRSLLEKLSQTKSWQRYQGADHVFSGSDWAVRFFANDVIRALVKNSILGHIENFDNAHWRCTVITPYSGSVWSHMTRALLFDALEMNLHQYACGDDDQRNCTMELERLWPTPEQAWGRPWSERPYMFFLKGQIDARAGYRQRRLSCEALRDVPGPHVCVSVSDPGKSTYERACPDNVFAALAWATNHTGTYSNWSDPVVPGSKSEEHLESGTTPDPLETWSQERCRSGHSAFAYLYQLAASKFCLMIRGDTLSSNRLYDCIRYNSIPIIISDGIERDGLPFYSRVPWHEFSFFVKEAQQPEQLTKAFVDIMATPPEKLEAMRQSMADHMPDVLWNMAGSRVFENFLLEAADRCLDNLETFASASDKEQA